MNMISTNPNDFDSNLKELFEIISSNPNTLFQMVDIIRENLEEAKEIQEKSPEDALKIIDDNLQNLYILKNKIPADKMPPISVKNFSKWSNDIDRLTNYNNQLKTKIESQRSLEKISLITQNEQFTHDSHSQIVSSILSSLWTNDTLQEPFHIKTFREIALPILYPSLFSFSSKTILIEGHGNTGKTYTLNKIKDLLNEQVPSKTLFYSVNSLEFESKLDALETEVQKNTSQHIFVITEFPTFTTTQTWTNQSIGRWLILLEKNNLKNVTWILLCRDSSEIKKEILDVLSPSVIHYHYPCSKTIYKYILSTLKEYYGLNSTELPEYINLPIVQNVVSLSKLSNQLERLSMDFNSINVLLNQAIKRNIYLAIRENAVYKIDGNLYFKNSISYPIEKDYQYYLLNDIANDVITFPNENGQPVFYWNVNLIDSLDSIEDDRFTGIWIDTREIESKSELSVIAALDVNVKTFPYHLDSHLQHLYGIVVNHYYKIWKMISNENLGKSKVPVEYQELISSVMRHKQEIQCTICEEDIEMLNPEIINDIFFRKEDYPMIYDNSFFQKLATHFTAKRQYLFVKKSEDDSASFFNLSYRGKTTKTADENGGIKTDISADELKQVIVKLTEQNVHVAQVLLSNGNMWIVDFDSDDFGKIGIHPSSESIEVLSMSALSILDEIRLSDDYCVTNESDLDSLIERFPLDFKECYRDEEHTWKMKKLSKEHVYHLNKIYNNEQKYYLSLYYHCLSLDREWMEDRQIEELDSFIEDVRNYVDFLFILTADKEENGTLTGNWSISSENPMLENREITLLEDKQTNEFFTVSPYHLIQIMKIISSNEMVELESIYKDFITYKHGIVEEEKEYVYIKSKISKSVWNKCVAVIHRLPNIEDIASDSFLNNGVYNYFRHFKKSLYYHLFANAEFIGTQSADKIQWFSFSNIPGLQKLVSRFRVSSQSWAHSRTPNNMASYLFSLVQLCISNQQELFERLLFAALIYLPDYYTSHTLTNVLEDIQKTPIIKRIVQKYANDATTEMEPMLKFAFEGQTPNKIEDSTLSKNILTRNEFNNIKVYGLKTSHIEEQL